MEKADFAEHAFGEVVLPFLGGAVTEVDAAAEGFDGVDGAEVVGLEGAAALRAGGGELGEGEGREGEGFARRDC